MRWQLGRRSENIEDRRGLPVSPMTGGIGCGGLILIGIIAYLTGQNPLDLLQQVTNDTPSAPVREAPPAGFDKERDFVSSVLGDTEDTWGKVFAASNQRYQPPKLVLFTEAVRSACGLGSAAVGPFYCPSDQKVYLDLGFF